MSLQEPPQRQSARPAAVVEVHELTRRFGGLTAVDGVSFCLERFEPDPSRHDLPVQEVLADLRSLAIEIAEVGSRTGRVRPSIIT